MKLLSWLKPDRTVSVSFIGKTSEAIIRTEKGKAYRGSVTVWRSYPDGRRVDSATEGWLADAYAKAVWERG